MSIAPSRLVVAAAALILLTGCSTTGPSSTPDSPPPPSVDTATPATPDPGDSAEEFGETWLATASEQFARTRDPEPKVTVTGEFTAEFEFPDGSAEGVDAISNCQIAMGAIGMEYDLTMRYPDGTVRCTDLLG